ncbi:MAG: hypothetical protein KIT73_13925 [Burkholderiales bacterium]|nr:hypothetical protein [Burkholderiales bacterium]
MSPHVVEWTSRVMERSGNPANVMDRHNNRIGAAIGSRARSFGEIEPTVHAQVLIGTDNATEPAQITWLSREQWRKGWLW